MNILKKKKFPSFFFSNIFFVSVPVLSVQYGDTLVSHCTCRQQRPTEEMRDGVQHSAGVWFIEHQRLTWPVQQQADPLGSLHHLQRHALPAVNEGVVPVVVGQHPGLTVVAQTGPVAAALSLQGGVTDAHFEGGTLADVHHPAVGAGRHKQGAQRVGPRVEACRVVLLVMPGFLMEEGQRAEVVGQGQQGAHGAFVKHQIGRSEGCGEEGRFSSVTVFSRVFCSCRPSRNPKQIGP